LKSSFDAATGRYLFYTEGYVTAWEYMRAFIFDPKAHSITPLELPKGVWAHSIDFLTQARIWPHSQMSEEGFALFMANQKILIEVRVNPVVLDPKDTGIYLLDETGKQWKKIGEVTDAPLSSPVVRTVENIDPKITISPDGCSLAHRVKLGVEIIDLCSTAKSPNNIQ
jgi:hypothetical protein